MAKQMKKDVGCSRIALLLLCLLRILSSASVFGFQTPSYRIKQALSASRHPIPKRQQKTGMSTLPLGTTKGDNEEEICIEKDPLLPKVSGEGSTPSTGQQVLSMAIPALGALLIDPLMALADTAFVGRYSTSVEQLAGMGSATALLTFSFYLFNFLCFATTPLVAARRSAGNEQGALEVGGQALSLALLLGSIMTIGLIAASQPLLQLMGTSQTGIIANKYATDFLIVRAFAAPAVLSISASTGILRGYLDTRTPLYILVVANLVNLALDFVLIAKFGMGPMGAAIATTTAEWISAVAFLLILAGKLPASAGSLGCNQQDGRIVSVTPSLSIPAWEDVKPLLVASSSLFLRSVVLQITLSSAAAMAARSGDENAAASVAAHQIAIQLWFLCNFICDALEAAAQGLVADALGRDSQTKAREISMTVFTYSLILGAILSTGLWIGDFTNFLEKFFTHDLATQMKLQEILTIIILSQPLNALVFAADGVLQGASEFPFQAKAMALSSSVAIAFFIAIQDHSHGHTLIHVWMALVVLQAVRGLTSLYKLGDNEGPINLFAAHKY